MAMVAVVPSRTTSGYDVAIEGSRSPLSKVAIERGLERELLEDTGLHLRVAGVKAVERTGFAIVLLMETELLDSTSIVRASAEVSEFEWVDPTTMGQLSRLNARLRHRALA
jgi:hypothetical protein